MALGAHLGDRRGQRLRLGHREDRTDQARHRGVGGRWTEQVAEVDEARHVVARARGHEVPGVSGVDRVRRRLLDRQPGVHRRHVVPGPHRLAEGAVAGVERAPVDLPPLRVDGVVLGDEVTELLGAHRLAAGVRIAAEQPDDRVRGAREDPDDRSHQRREPVERRGDQHREALGALQGESLRHEFAEHEGQVRDHEGEQHERDRLGGTAVESEPLQERGDVRGDRRRTVGGREEPGDGHADLDGGEEAVRVAAQPGDPLTAGSAPLELLQLGLAERDEGDLGSGEHTADEHEEDDEPEGDPGVGAHQRVVRSGRGGTGRVRALGL